MAWMEHVLLFLRGYRKLLVALITIAVVLLMFGISLGLLLKAFLDGGQFVDVVKALASVVSTVVVAYMGTNMGKHLLDAGKDMFSNWVKRRKR